MNRRSKKPLGVAGDGKASKPKRSDWSCKYGCKHRVAVTEYSPREPPPPPIMDRAFANLQTSGLEINVEGRTSEILLKVRQAKPTPRK